MSSYADRLNQFNQAASTASDHIGRLKDTLSNKELRENPVKMGLDVAGQTLGTAEGIVRIRAMMKSDDVQRNVQNAFYNKLRDLATGKKNLADTVAETVNEAKAAAGQSASSFLSDTGSTLKQSVAKVQKGESTLADKINPSASDLDAVDGGLSQGLSEFPRNASQSSEEANELNRNINQKLNSGLSTEERSALNDRLGSSIGNIGDINDLPDGAAKTEAMGKFLNSKNNVANDALARKAQGLPDPDSYTETGQPLQSSAAPSGSDNTGLNVGGETATQDAANGAANVGDNASSTVARNALSDNGSNLIPSDVQNAITGDDSDILQRGASLGLNSSTVPAQGGGEVPGLSTLDAPSSQANTISRAQQFAADTHSSAQSSASGLKSDFLEDPSNTFKLADQEFGDEGANLGKNLASKASNTADELSEALKTEETLDVLAPDTGPLAPILEAGGLLATLGTGIASLFTSDKASSPPPPPPKQKLGISIGADLQTSASGNVGAF